MPTPTEARITRIQIITKESPTFGGYSWPGVGQYEKIVGKAFGEVDPPDPKNAVIVDIAARAAERPAATSSTLVRLLHPEADRPEQGRAQGHVRAAEPRRQDLERVGPRCPGGNDPGSITDPTVLANAFLMPRGYTMVWSGWDLSAGTEHSRTSTRRSPCRSRRIRTAPRSPGRRTNTS